MAAVSPQHFWDNVAPHFQRLKTIVGNAWSVPHAGNLAHHIYCFAQGGIESRHPVLPWEDTILGYVKEFAPKDVVVMSNEEKILFSAAIAERIFKALPYLAPTEDDRKGYEAALELRGYYEPDEPDYIEVQTAIDALTLKWNEQFFHQQKGLDWKNMFEQAQRTSRTSGVAAVELWQKSDTPLEKIQRANSLMQGYRIDIVLRLLGQLKLAVGKPRVSNRANNKTLGLTYGNDLPSVYTTEFALPKAQFALNFVEGGLAQYSRGKVALGGGPIVLLIDVSSSMEDGVFDPDTYRKYPESGARIEWAKALSVAIIDIAATQKRDVAIFRYDDICAKVYEGRASWEAIQTVLGLRLGGSTETESALFDCLEFIGGKCSATGNFRKADIMLVTDENYTRLRRPDELRAEMNRTKTQLHISRITQKVNQDDLTNYKLVTTSTMIASVLDQAGLAETFGAIAATK
jgi:hypothetical protein